MPEMQEVFRMATQKVRPDPGFVDRQYENQRRQSRRRKAGALALVAVLVVAGVVIGISTLRSGDEEGDPWVRPDTDRNTRPIAALRRSRPGTYVVKTLDPDFDASYRITMDVPDGYESLAEGVGVEKVGRIGQMAVSAWVIGDVYADPCRWSSTLLDPPPVSSVDARHRPRGPEGTPRVDADRHHGRRLRRYVHGADRARRDHPRRVRRGPVPTLARHQRGERYLEPGQRDMLWIIDVGGVPLLIDASLGQAGTSAQDRAEHIQIAESVQIDPQ